MRYQLLTPREKCDGCCDTVVLVSMVCVCVYAFSITQRDDDTVRFYHGGAGGVVVWSLIAIVSAQMDVGIYVVAQLPGCVGIACAQCSRRVRCQLTV